MKKRARKILFANYTGFLFATIFYIALSFGAFILSSSYAGLIFGYAGSAAMALATVTFEFVSMILCLPLFFGYISFCVKLIRSEECPLSEIFRYYASKQELKSVYSFFMQRVPMLFIKVFLPLYIMTAVYYLLPIIYDYATSSGKTVYSQLLQNLYFVPAFLTLTLCFFFFGKEIHRTLCFCADISPKERSYKANAFMKCRLSMIPAYIASVLSFGVLFPIYTVPMTIIVYCLFSGVDEKNDNIMKHPDSKTIEFKTSADTEENTKNADTVVFDINTFNENNERTL